VPAIEDLEVELETYRRLHAQLLADHAGRFALIHGEDLIDVFDDERSALVAGYRAFGYVPLLVKRIVEVESPAVHATYFLPERIA
jgi:hypothetical protein